MNRSYQPIPDVGGASSTSSSHICVQALQILTAFSAGVVYPVLLLLKVDGSITSISWAILWTPLWILDGFMFSLAAINVVATDFAERIWKDYERLVVFLSLPLEVERKSAVVSLIKTVLFIVIQILVIFKIDGRIGGTSGAADADSWIAATWFDVFMPWIFYEVISVVALIPSVCSISKLQSSLSVSFLPSISDTGSLVWPALDEEGGRGELEPEEIKAAIVAIDASDVEQRDGSPCNEQISKILEFKKKGTRYLKTGVTQDVFAEQARRIESEERKFEENLSRRLDQNGFFVCGLRIWLAVSLARKLDDTTPLGPSGVSGTNWSLVLLPVWVYALSQFLFAFALRAWARSLLCGLDLDRMASGADRSPSHRSRYHRGSRLLSMAAVGCVLVSFPLVCAVLVVMRFDGGSSGAAGGGGASSLSLSISSLWMMALPVLLGLIACCCCCYRASLCGSSSSSSPSSNPGREQEEDGAVSSTAAVGFEGYQEKKQKPQEKVSPASKNSREISIDAVSFITRASSINIASGLSAAPFRPQEEDGSLNPVHP